MAEVKDPRFQVVGINWKARPQTAAKPVPKRRLAGKPVFAFVLLLAIVLGCLFAGQLANHDPSGYYLQNLNEAPDSSFYFGTDSLGRDIYSMIWYGGRVSLSIGLMSMVIITALGITYGCISGLANTGVDAVMMRIMEMANSIPTLLLLLLLMSVIGKANAVTLAAAIGVTGWFALARLVRSEVRQIRNSEYVLAARCMGVGFGRIMTRHLIPNFVSSILFVIIASISSSISMESTLSFLGLGLPVDVISWGSMLSLANRALLLNTWWVIIIPGVFLLVTLNAITSIGNAFRKGNTKKPSNL
ncbi:MAG: ABC transporter permease [Intestinimonas sp.]|jgi:peptide/nickel transport system permease protein|nr:ABC transporter permease [Intestinimonas sp.]